MIGVGAPKRITANPGRQSLATGHSDNSSEHSGAHGAAVRLAQQAAGDAVHRLPIDVQIIGGFLDDFTTITSPAWSSASSRPHAALML
jgi:hypothetical protein